MDKKFEIYAYGLCPYCGGDLKEAGKTKSGNYIVQCINCGAIMLEKDINKIKRELNEK